jgi:hypothetical protein
MLRIKRKMTGLYVVEGHSWGAENGHIEIIDRKQEGYDFDKYTRWSVNYDGSCHSTLADAKEHIFAILGHDGLAA